MNKGYTIHRARDAGSEQITQSQFWHTRSVVILATCEWIGDLSASHVSVLAFLKHIGETNMVFEQINSYLAETAANTLAYYNAEVPNSQGAKNVLLTRIELGGSIPETVVGLTGDSSVEKAAYRGKITPTQVNESNAGCLLANKQTRYNLNGVIVTDLLLGQQEREIPNGIPILKDGSDGKYYVTVAVKGVAQTAVKTVNYHFEFNVIK